MLSHDAVVVVHEATGEVTGGDDTQGAREVGEANLKLVEVVTDKNVGHRGDKAVVYCVEGGVEPEGGKGVFVEDDAKAAEEIGETYTEG